MAGQTLPVVESVTVLIN